MKSNSSSSVFAYVLGVVYGDGYVRVRKSKYRTGGEIVLKVKERNFSLNFKKCLEQWSKRKAKLKKEKDGRYGVYLYSKPHAEQIQRFKMGSIINLKYNFQNSFLRGLFDSDGGIVGKNLKHRNKAKRWLHFYNNNKNLIRLIKLIFNERRLKYSIKSRIHSGFGSKKIQYEIKIYSLKDINYFYKNIGFSIPRKQKLLKQVVESYD